MNRPLPRGGTDRDAISVYDLLAAVKVAQREQKKLWFRLRMDNDHIYEVYPGGRNIAWPHAILNRRHERQAPLPADFKCKHVWQRELGFVQCWRCGQVREDRIGKEKP